MEFDFEKMAALAREDPDEFERMRSTLLEELIASHPNPVRAKGLQNRIDLERRRARTPLGACIRITSLMWANFYHLDEELHSLVDLVNAGPEVIKEDRPQEAFPPAKILPFKK